MDTKGVIMGQAKDRYLLLGIFVCLLMVMAQLSSASVFLGKDRYVSTFGDTLNDDLYYLGTGEAVIDGYVANDLVITGKRYTISGEVGGNLNSATQFATIRGTVRQSARMFAMQVTIDGQILNNLIVFAKDVEIGRSAEIGRDALICGNDISVSGSIGGDLIIRGDQVVISGKILGNVDIEANRITLLPPAEILGDLSYKSKKEIKIRDDVVITGVVDWDEVTADDDDADGGGEIPIILKVILFMATSATGLLAIGLFNKHARTAAKMVIDAPLPCVGIGFVAVLLGPIAILILLTTVIGAPASVILMFAYTIFFYLSKIYVALAVGQFACERLLGKNPKQGWSFMLGLIIITGLFWIPVIGWFVYFGVLFFGFGAILLGIRECNRTGDNKAINNLQPPESIA